MEKASKPDGIANSIPKPTIELQQRPDGPGYIDFTYKGARFASRRATNLPNLNFADLSRLIAGEDTMLHPSSEELRDSWEADNSVVAFDAEGKIMGHARLEDLPPKNNTEINMGGSEKEVKKVYEIGSVIVTGEEGVRGNGFASVLLEATMKLKVQEVKNGDAIFISTTKLVRDSKYMFALISAGKRLGIDFTPAVHTEFDEISKRTCICSHPFGQGRQLSDHCPARISEEGLRTLKDRNEFPDGERNCVLLISNPSIDRPLTPFRSNGANGVSNANI